MLKEPMKIYIAGPVRGVANYKEKGVRVERRELVPMMDFEVSDDLTLNAVAVRGRIRIVEPEYRF